MAPPRVSALIDRSAYAASVGEHGAWLAARIGASLQLRHVRETDETVETAKTLLTDASERLADNGAPTPNLSLVEGGVLAGAISAEGRRGGLVLSGRTTGRSDRHLPGGPAWRRGALINRFGRQSLVGARFGSGLLRR